MGVSHLTLFKRIKKEIPFSSVSIVDTIPLSKFTQVEYTINIKNLSGSLSKSLKMTVNRSDVNVVDSVSHRIGSPMGVGVDAMTTGSNFNLQFSNAELFNIIVTITRTFQ